MDLILTGFLAIAIAGCWDTQIVADVTSDTSTFDTDTNTDTGVDSDTQTSETLVVVGRDCLLGYSTDQGLTWSLSDQSGDCGSVVLEGIAYGNGIWIVVGSSETVLRSTDGQEWTVLDVDVIPGGTFHLESVAFDGAGLWIAGGIGGEITYSEDNGESWTNPEGEILDAQNVQAIATDRAGRWVAVSDGGSGAISNDPIYTVNWAGIDLIEEDFESVVFDDGKWIAVGGNGTILTSDDGIDWATQGPICSGYDLEDIVHNGSDQWLVVGEAGCLAYSETAMATTWTNVMLQDGDAGAGCVYISNDDRWVVLGTDGKIFYSEDAAATWERVPDDSVFDGEVPILVRSN